MSNQGRFLRRKIMGKSVPEKDRIKKWKILAGDTVEMMAGEDKRKQGKVLKVLRKKNKLVVKGINVTKRHVKRGVSDTQNGGYWFAESPVHYSRVLLVDPITKHGVRVRWGFVDGKKERISKKTKTVIPKPPVVYKNPKKRTTIGPKDTLSASVLLETFDPDTLNPLLNASLEHKTRHKVNE